MNKKISLYPLYFSLWIGAFLMMPYPSLAQKKETKDSTHITELPQFTAYGVQALITKEQIVHANRIKQAKIRTSGNSKLSDVLETQIGLAYVNSSSSSRYGTGLQVMGLSEEYLQLLENGQPMIGRNGGILNVNRIPSFFIEELELIKGGMTSLYGDNAISGVINVITVPNRKNVAPLQVELTLNHTGQYQLDLSSSWSLSQKNLIAIQASGSKAEGYKLSPKTGVYAIDPNYYLSKALHWVYRPHPKHQLRLSGKGFFTYLKGPITGYNEFVTNESSQWDYNGTLEWKFQPTQKVYIQSSLYYASYQSDYKLRGISSSQLLDSQSVFQSTWRPSLAIKWHNVKNGTLIVGTDIDIQYLSSTRYLQEHQINNYALFLQQSFSVKKWKFNGGLRFDFPDGFNQKISPQLAAQYKEKKWEMHASISVGYKTPDFRHRFLFFPHTSIGYIIIGREILQETLENAVALSPSTSTQTIQAVYNNNKLKAESAFSFQMGATYQINQNQSISLWLFRNDIDNLIEPYVLPVKTNNNLPIYSYRNVNHIYTQGIDLTYKARIGKHNLSAGFHFLHTADKEVEESIRKGEVYARAASGKEYKVQPSQYLGLFLRPRYIATLSAEGPIKNLFFYQMQCRIQSQMGWNDQNNSQYFDHSNEVSNDLYTVHMSLYKNFEKKDQWQLRVQAGVRNVLDQHHPTFYPTMRGANVYIKLYFQLY